jgi:hypothetical protein
MMRHILVRKLSGYDRAERKVYRYQVLFEGSVGGFTIGSEHYLQRPRAHINPGDISHQF